MFTQKFIKIFHSIQEIRLFSLLIIVTSAKPRPNTNDILQSLGQHLVNINAYAKFYQNIPSGLRFIDIFHEQAGDKIFTNRSGQNLHKLSGDKIKCLITGHTMKFNFQFQMTFLGSCNFITIFRSVQEIGQFSLLQNLEHSKASTDEKCHFAISWARSC